MMVSCPFIIKATFILAANRVVVELTKATETRKVSLVVQMAHRSSGNGQGGDICEGLAGRATVEKSAIRLLERQSYNGLD